MFLTLLFQEPMTFILVAAALVVSLSVHEFAHAWVAMKLGDFTAKYMGRVTLNPLSHLDPIGTLLLLVAGFGWGRPVPFDPSNLENPKRDGAIISFAGPLSNFILALGFALIFHLLNFLGTLPEFAATFLYLTVTYNLILGVFNLIPIHPLDGFKIVYGLLPYNLAFQWMQLAPYGIYLLLVLVITRSTSLILDPLLNIGLALLGF